MAKYAKSDEIYSQLVDESDENWLYGLVSFAVIEEQRIEWAKHHEEYNGQPPTPEQVAQWYESQPESVLLRAKGTAENALQAYADEVLDTFYDQARKDVEEGIIIGEIRAQNRFLQQFGVSLAASLASALVLAALLIVFAFLVFSDTSPVDIGKQLADKTEVITDGEDKEQTSKRAATAASKVLRNKSTSKAAKSAAGSALSQRKAPQKVTRTKAASAASKTLRKSSTSKSAKSAAGSALTQKPDSKRR